MAYEYQPVTLVRVLARDATAPYRFSVEEIEVLLDLFHSPVRAALACVHQDIARLASDGVVTSRSIGDLSVSRSTSLADLKSYASWLEGQVSILDGVGGAIDAGVMFRESMPLFAVGMHDTSEAPSSLVPSIYWDDQESADLGYSGPVYGPSL